MQKPVGGRSFAAKTAKPKFNLYKREGVSSSSTTVFSLVFPKL